MKILVTGGAGYIGSHTAKLLSRAGHEVFVFDNLSRGNRWAVKWGPLIEGELLDEGLLFDIFECCQFDAVLHFAALAYVGESVAQAARYFETNVQGTLCLLRAMRYAGVERLVFSSSCAVFGQPASMPVTEETPQDPCNPYGESKRIVEQILRWEGACHGLKWVALRYFNAAGCDPDGEIGEWHQPEPHLIPNILQSLGPDGKPFRIFGTDYSTPDGTCIRDYIHVNDLASAHLMALEYLGMGGASCALNLGTGDGYSVRQIINRVESITGSRVPIIECARRGGDPAVLVASSRKARDTLGWAPRTSSLDEIVGTAWMWHSLCSPVVTCT